MVNCDKLYAQWILSYTLYNLPPWSQTVQKDAKRWTVHRRYSDFADLHSLNVPFDGDFFNYGWLSPKSFFCFLGTEILLFLGGPQKN